MSTPLYSTSRFLIVLFLFGLLLPASSWAQAERDTTDGPSVLQEGGWGLKFQMTSLNGLLSGFEGSLLAARYHVSPHQAFRLGLSAEASSSNTDQTTRREEREREIGRHRYRGFVQYIHYVQPADPLYVFAGVGLRGGYNTSNREEIRKPDGQGERKEIETTTETTYSVGLSGTIGVEWFVHPNLSLSVEYPLGVDYLHENSETTNRIEGESSRRESRTRETNQFSAGGESVRIGITFSFAP